MSYDFVNELGHLALATRLKRISEAMVHSGRQLYKTLEIDIEPSWFLIFKLLEKYQSLSVTQISSKLHFSHPSVVNLVQKMESGGWLNSHMDHKDSRKKNYSLSPKAETVLPELTKIWEASQRGIRELFNEDSQFLKELEHIEIQLSQQDFMQRTLKHYRNESTNT